MGFLVCYVIDSGEMQTTQPDLHSRERSLDLMIRESTIIITTGTGIQIIARCKHVEHEVLIPSQINK